MRANPPSEAYSCGRFGLQSPAQYTDWSALYISSDDIIEYMRKYVVSTVKFETSGMLALLDPKDSRRLSFVPEWMCGGSSSATQDPVAGYYVVCHTHPIHALAVSCNSPSSCPTGADVFLDILNSTLGGACSLTFTTNGVFVTWPTSAARALLMAAVSPREKEDILRFLYLAISAELEDRYSLGDAVASLCNERDLLCDESKDGRLRAVQVAMESAPANRHHIAALVAAYRGSPKKNNAACKDWVQLMERMSIISNCARYVNHLSTAERRESDDPIELAAQELRSLAPVFGRAGVSIFLDQPLLNGKFFALEEIVRSSGLDLPPEAFAHLLSPPGDGRQGASLGVNDSEEGSPVREPADAQTFHDFLGRPSFKAAKLHAENMLLQIKMSTVKSLSRNEFANAFVVTAARQREFSAEAEAVAKQIWSDIATAKAGFAAGEIARLVLSFGRVKLGSKSTKCSKLKRTDIDVTALREAGVVGTTYSHL